jgi:hypothetical protein
VFVQLAHARRSFWFGALGAVFILINLATALGNVATLSDETRDGRSSAIERKRELTLGGRPLTRPARRRSTLLVRRRNKRLRANYRPLSHRMRLAGRRAAIVTPTRLHFKPLGFFVIKSARRRPRRLQRSSATK